MGSAVLGAVALMVLGCRTIQDNLPYRPGVPLSSIEIASKGLVLWRIEASVPRPELDLRYGVVPEEFTQVVPRGHPPRLLVPGERLELRYQYADGRITILAQAVSVTGIREKGGTPPAPPR
jgi:hypothetical protein